MTIRQSDITNNSISFSRYGTISFTTGVLEMDGNVSITSYAIGVSTGMTATQPLFIKESGTSITGWVDQQDWTIYNVAVSTGGLVLDVSSGSVTVSWATTTITTGDLIGICGPGAWNQIFSPGAGALLVARSQPTSLGSQKATLICGGLFTRTDFFNGSTWIAGSNSNITVLRAGTAGSVFAGLIFAGGTTNSDLFNGSTWTLGSTLSSVAFNSGGAGSQNAALNSGGSSTATDVPTLRTDLFNGSTWSVGNNMNVSADTSAVFGFQNGALVAAGDTQNAGVRTDRTELFNGSTWAFAGPTKTRVKSVGGVGTPNSGLLIGGDNIDPLTETELFNGSVWCMGTNMSKSRMYPATSGSQMVALAAGGQTGSGTLTDCEIYNQSIYRKISFPFAKMATNLAVATNVSASTANAKLNGYISNMLVTSSNIQVTTAAQWAGNYLVLSRFSPNAATTGNFPSVMSKTNLEADDLVVGYSYSQTQSYIYGNNLYGLQNKIIW